MLTGVVTRVLDGDTLVLETGLRVRLAGVNAPEADECYSSQAADRLRALSGADLEIEVVGIDQFDRTLAYVWSQGTLVNLDLVARGLALASTPAEGDPYGRSLVQAEEAAYAQRLGMWSPHACGGGPLPSLEIDPDHSQPNPDGPDEEVLQDELVVIVNRGGQPVALGGWVLRDESSRHRYRFPTDAELAPGEVFVVSSDLPGWDPGGSPVWNNSGDMALLLDPRGTVVDRWRYGR